MTPQTGSYPIQVSLPQDRDVNRWWGLLWFGMVVRYILLIPQYIIFVVLVIVAFIVYYVVLWIPILILGRVPTFWNTLIEQILKRYARTSAYLLLFPGGYPGLMEPNPGDVDVQVSVQSQKIGRLWGIFFLSPIARLIALIPHLVVLYVLGIAAGVWALVAWIPVLVNGKYPDSAIRFIGMVLRYSVRVQGWFFMLPVPYPPFDFNI